MHSIFKCRTEPTDSGNTELRYTTQDEDYLEDQERFVPDFGNLHTTIDEASNSVSALRQPLDEEESQCRDFGNYDDGLPGSAGETILTPVVSFSSNQADSHNSALSLPDSGRNQHCQFPKDASQDFSTTASKIFIALSTRD